MTREQMYEKVKEIFLEVCDIEAGQRREMIELKCDGDGVLRDAVEAYLRHYEPETNGQLTATNLYRHEPREKTPETLGPYRVVRTIGRGGMGVVYLGVRDDDRFKRRVAIKVLKRGTDTDEVLNRFDLERQVLASLNHPGIARLYDAGETDDSRPYFVMEYVEGSPIDEYCDTHRLTILERLELFRLVCAAVGHAHQNLVVHRDLKPGNIVVDQEGTPKLLDFGIAKIIHPEFVMLNGDLTLPGMHLMTPEYASPEQVRGDSVGTTSDVYSLGVLLYELLTGHRPYRIDTRVRAELERVICNEEPQKPSTAISRVADPAETTRDEIGRRRESSPDKLRRRLAGDIDNIILKAMQKAPQRRYSSVERFEEDIVNHLLGRPVTARPNSVTYRCGKFLTRNKVGVGVAGLGVVALTSVAFGVWHRYDAGQQQKLAAAEARQVDLLEERNTALAARADAESKQADELAQSLATLSAVIKDVHGAIEHLAGATSARALLASHVVEYLREVEEAAGDRADLQAALADAYDTLGAIQGGRRSSNLGSAGDAKRSFDRALEIRESLVDRYPDVISYRLGLAQSHLNGGDVLRDAERRDEAVARYESGLVVLDGIPTRWGPHQKSQMLLTARLITSIGDIRSKQKRFDEARRHHEESFQIRLRASGRFNDADSRRAFASGHVRMGQLCRDEGKLDEAQRHFEENLEIRQRVAASDPKSATFKRGVFTAQWTLGLFHREQRHDPATSREHLEAAAGVARELADLDRANVRARHDLARVYEQLSKTYAALDESVSATQTAEMFSREAEKLFAIDPRPEIEQLLGFSHFQIGNILRDAGRTERAAEQYRRALDILGPLSEAHADNERLAGNVLIIRDRLLSLSPNDP